MAGLGANLIGLVVLATITSVVPTFAQGGDLFQKGSISVEFGAAPMFEIWNINEEHEQVLEGTAAIWGSFRDRIAIGVEFHHAWVFQDAPGAFVQGLSPLIRLRLTKRPTWNWYVETGPGVSWSDLTTPVRGTRFNFLFQAGTGFIRRTGDNSNLLIAYRFFHLSNNGREGKDHNPDLEMMGPYLGWSLSF